MGLSSSQARLLTLTTRMHQIEYKAAKLEAQKLQMANESRRVYEEYLDALEATKVQIKTLNTDGSASYVDMTSYDDFLNAGFALKYKGLIYTNKIYTSGHETDHVVGMVITPELMTAYSITPAMLTAVGKNVGDYVYVDTNTHSLVPNSFVADETFKNLVYKAFNAEVEPTGENFETIITNLINSGEVVIVAKEPNGTFKNGYETSVATNTSLQEVSDEKLLRKAEAKYEADMRKIDAKDRKFDTDLAAIEAERNAIKSEMETLKTVAKDNVERTFKLFS